MEVQPQTDREWMMMLSQDVKMLSNSINKFAEKIEIFEERKLVDAAVELNTNTFYSIY